MKKLIFGITLFALMAFSVDAHAYSSSVERAYSDHIRQSDGKINSSVSIPGLDIAKGLSADDRSINVFARNIEIDQNITADIWDGGHTLASGGSVSLIWVAPTTARQHSILSSSANDTSGGTGARTLALRGLISWDTPEILEVIAMNGQTTVTTDQSYVMINSMDVLTKGATASNDGIITARALVDGTVTSQIRAGEGHTHQSPYGISSLDTMYIGRLYGNINKAGGNAGLVDLSLEYNPEPDSELTNFNIRQTFGLQTVGSSASTINYWVPKTLPGPALIKVQCISGTANQDVSIGYDAVITTDTSGFNALILSQRRTSQNLKILTTADGRVLMTSP